MGSRKICFIYFFSSFLFLLEKDSIHIYRKFMSTKNFPPITISMGRNKSAGGSAINIIERMQKSPSSNIVSNSIENSGSTIKRKGIRRENTSTLSSCWGINRYFPKTAESSPFRAFWVLSSSSFLWRRYKPSSHFGK